MFSAAATQIAVYQKFGECHFITQKTAHCFSMVANDHVHKQPNAVLKGDSGIIDTTENEPVLKQWLIVGLEMARIINDVEVSLSQKMNKH